MIEELGSTFLIAKIATAFVIGLLMLCTSKTGKEVDK